MKGICGLDLSCKWRFRGQAGAEGLKLVSSGRYARGKSALNSDVTVHPYFV